MGEQQKLIFTPVIEALFGHGLNDRMTPAFRSTLAGVGIDLGRLLPGYDYSVWEAAIIEATTLFPELSREDALMEIGLRALRANIDASPTGKALMPVLRILGVTRAIKRSVSRRGSDNFNVTTFGAETARSLEVKMSFVGEIPHFALGTLVGLATAFGGKTSSGKVLHHERGQATFLVEWS